MKTEARERVDDGGGEVEREMVWGELSRVLGELST
jgi:hypothetical protein